MAQINSNTLHYRKLSSDWFWPFFNIQERKSGFIIQFSERLVLWPQLLQVMSPQLTLCMFEKFLVLFGKVVQRFWKRPLFRKWQATITYSWAGVIVETSNVIFPFYSYQRRKDNSTSGAKAVAAAACLALPWADVVYQFIQEVDFMQYCS
jgi:hypothetical protein